MSSIVIKGLSSLHLSSLLLLRKKLPFFCCSCSTYSFPSGSFQMMKATVLVQAAFRGYRISAQPWVKKRAVNISID